MSRIDAIFGQLRSAGRKGLMPFVCGGHPSVDVTERVLPALAAAGASVIEVGIPFSDPIADGPTIASAMHGVLSRGVTPRDVFEAVRRARPETDAGLVAMVSVSIIERLGSGRFGEELVAAGFDGVIVPDVPVEEAERHLEPMRTLGLTTTLLVAPTTPEARLERIVAVCSGFVYVLARVGITGEEGGGPGVDAGFAARIATLRSLTDLPLACGFGIGSPEQVRQVVQHADAAIVGSALVKRMEQGNDPVGAAREFVETLAAGLGPSRSV